MDNIDDQMRVNKALDSMDVQWRQLNNDKYYQGITSGSTPLTVTMLPRAVVCRSCGKNLATKFYVWHQHGMDKNGTRKKTVLSMHNIWVLKDNWSDLIWEVTHTPKQWLLNIAN